MLSKRDLQIQILKCLHWAFSNFSNTIIIDVDIISEGEEYYINTLWQKISYISQAGDTALHILTALNLAWEGEEASTSVVDDQLVITKNLSDYFYFFELSDNLKFIKFLQGKILIQDQNSPQPDKTYLTIKIISGLNDLGGNNIKYEDNYKLLNLKRFTLNIQAYGSESFDYLNYFKSILMLDEVVNFCQNEGVSFVSAQDLIDVSKLINDGIEQRHSLDIICYTKEEINLSMVPAESAIINLNLG